MTTPAASPAVVPPLALALCRSLQAAGVAFWASFDGNSMRLAWAEGFAAPSGTPADEWKRTLQAGVARSAVSRRPVRITPKNGQSKVEVIFVPVMENGRLLGVAGLAGGLALVEACESHRDILLESLSLLAKAIRSPAPSGEADLSSLALGLVSSRGKSDAARLAADALQAALGGGRAALFEKSRGTWRVLSCSGVKAVDQRSAAAQELLARFESALRGGPSEGYFASALARWHDDSSARHLGLLTEGSWGDRRDKVMRSAAPLVAHALHARRTVVQRLWPEPDDESPAARQKARTAKLATSLVAGALAIFLLWPFPQTFKGACELVPSQRGAAVAEIGGRIDEILVAEGDSVVAGQAVARIDSGEIRALLEAAKQSESQAGAEAREQQQRNEMGAFRRAQLEQRRVAEEVARLTLDLGRCTVRAPLDGVILTKDLALMRGQVAQPGMVICEIAALSGWDLRIKLDELEAGPLERALERAGALRVRYSLQARSDLALEGTLDSPRQISQMAYPEEKGTFIFVTLRGIGLPEALRSGVRPGFSGLAKIEGPRRPLLFSALARLWQRVRLHLFL